jgi:hypothetical protein
MGSARFEKTGPNGFTIAAATSNLLVLQNALPRRLTRSPGFHASEMGHLCARLETFKRVLPLVNDGKKFPAKDLKVFEVGHHLHHRWQNHVLGPAGILKGTWACSRCEFDTEGFMPKDPCPSCSWPVHDGKRLTGVNYPPPEYETIDFDCSLTCTWTGGFSSPDRDCRLCARGGEWRLRESGVRIAEWSTSGEDDFVVGRYDGVVHVEGQDYVLEIKSWGYRIDEPYPPHLVQANIYMWGTGIPRCVLVYINKVAGTETEFWIERDDAVIDRVRSDVARVLESARTSTLPTGICASRKDPEAEGCPYKKPCFIGSEDVSVIREYLRGKGLLEAS